MSVRTGGENVATNVGTTQIWPTLNKKAHLTGGESKNPRRKLMN